MKNLFMVERSVFDLKLSPHCFMVYMFLKSSSNRDSNECWPSLNTIARKTGVSRSTVEKAIGILKSQNLITVKNRTKDNHKISNMYTVK